MKKDTSTPGGRLSWTRKEILHLSQEELAEALGIGVDMVKGIEQNRKKFPQVRAKQVEDLTAKKAEAARQAAKKSGRKFTADDWVKHPHIRAAWLLGLDDYETELEQTFSMASAKLSKVFQPLGFLHDYADTLGYHFEPHEEETEEYPDGFYELKKGEALIRRISQDELMEISKRIERFARMEILHLAGEF